MTWNLDDGHIGVVGRCLSKCVQRESLGLLHLRVYKLNSRVPKVKTQTVQAVCEPGRRNGCNFMASVNTFLALLRQAGVRQSRVCKLHCPSPTFFPGTFKFALSPFFIIRTEPRMHGHLLLSDVVEEIMGMLMLSKPKSRGRHKAVGCQNERKDGPKSCMQG